MKKIRFLLRYISYLAKSTNEHGVHSPFVFTLLTGVIKDKTRHEEYHLAENIRKALLRDHKEISVTDYGAGSAYSNSKKRTVSSIARNAAKSKKYGRLLYRLADHFQPKNILELGTSLGISTLYLAAANKNAKVVTIEGCKECAEIATQNFTEAGLSNIQVITGNFDEVLPQVLNKNQPFDFIFIDGNHRKHPTLNYFLQCLSHITENAVMVFDDIHWSEEMEEAWEEVKLHNDVSVTIDLFFVGLIFFRKNQRKQDFVIRF